MHADTTMDSRRDLTDQQRERITQNFRAAKIIRDRKRSQSNANSRSPLPSPASPWTGNVGRGRFSLDSTSHSCAEFRSPVSKKKNSTLSPGELQRKALTELRGNQTGQGLMTPMEIRNIRMDFLACEPPGTTTTENYNIQKENLHTPDAGKSFSSICESEVANGERTGNSEQSCLDGLSQIFDESLLREIDALCAKQSTGNGSVGATSVAVPNLGVQDQDRMFGASTALVGGNHSSGVKIHLEWPREVQTELSSGYVSDGLYCKELVPPEEPSLDVAIHFPPLDSTGIPDDRSQTALTDRSLLPSELPRSEHPSTTSSVVNPAVPSHLQKLNASQREAATSDTTKPLLILAGPGSGKTSTMVARLLTLIQEGVQPANILAMTFTTAAATEMKERVAAAVGKTVSKELAVSTFHSFCLQLCRSHADKLGRTTEFLVFGPGQQRKAVVEATRIAITERKAGDTAGLADEKKPGDDNPALWKEQARKFQQIVTQAKCAGKTSADFEKSGNVLVAAVLRNYEKTLASCDALDYHDFITCAVKLLNDHTEVLEDCQRTWPCILVDEFQDTSTMQYCFLRALAAHNRITIVGDDDQSIFGFNGANSTGFDSFRIDFPGYKEVRLDQNYRSTRCIVEAAAALIRNNFKRCQAKRVFTENILGDKVS